MREREREREERKKIRKSSKKRHRDQDKNNIKNNREIYGDQNVSDRYKVREIKIENKRCI